MNNFMVHLHLQTRDEIMKDPALLSSPIYPPIKHSKPPLSTNRDAHLKQPLSHDRFIFKSQVTLLYIHPTNYNFKFNDKNQDFCFPLLSLKFCRQTDIGLTTALTISLQCNLLLVFL